MRHRFLPTLALLSLATACQDRSPTDIDTAGAQASASAAVEGRWIVVFDNSVADPPGLARRLVAGHGGTLHYAYQHALKGFAASLPDAAVQALQRNPQVAYIEADQPVWAFEAQSNATWGLDRIDQRALPLDKTYTYEQDGAGVTAYIIDTGIRFTHAEFGGRAVSGFDAVDGGTADDCNGHGTHVAGTVGGTVYGVAKSASLVAVRVLDCGGSGLTSGVIAGVDWVTANHVDPAVANMSLGSGASIATDLAVSNSIAAGVSYAVAAGNGNRGGVAQDACNYSPARVAEAMTIGATTSTDAKASFSNYGDCVDWFAPGVSITSAWYTSTTATATISGTSMATPHTAGVAALYLAANPGATPAQLRTALYEAATKGIVTSANTANNHLLYTPYATPVDPPPAGDITLTSATLSYLKNGTRVVSLAWTGGNSASVDIVRNGTVVATTPNDGAYQDTLNKKTTGTFTYQVCEADTTTCTDPITVTIP